MNTGWTFTCCQMCLFEQWLSSCRTFVRICENETFWFKGKCKNHMSLCDSFGLWEINSIVTVFKLPAGHDRTVNAGVLVSSKVV